MAGNNKAARFLKAMSNKPKEIAADAPPLKVVPETPTPAEPVRAKPGKAPSQVKREAQKHFGGYLDEATMETIALLRIRLKVDNSELIKLAVDELARKHSAKKAFGDA